MKAYAITIGDEILIGQVLNTNAAYIGEKLSSIGIPVTIMSVVGDEEEEIIDELQRAQSFADVIIATGGLGPTHDDKTRSAICKFFSTDLVFSETALENIKGLLQRRNYPWTKAAEDQAYIPRIATSIDNKHGTAPGYWIEHKGKYYIVMPGVPYEMKSMMEDFVLPRLSEITHGNIIRHRTLKTTGIPEAFLAQKLGNIDELTDGAQLAFLPSPTGVRLRITVRSTDRQETERKLEEVEQRIRKKAGKYIYAVGEIDLEVVLADLLRERKLTIAVAESCTGGLIADRITNIPGSSAYFVAGIVAYSNEAKTKYLGVSPDLIKQHGAVSKEVAIAMAEGIRVTSNTDIGLSITGIAGPSGGTPEKPVGLVWIGYSDKDGSFAMKFHFGDERLRVKERSSQAALEIVRRKILGIPVEENMNTD